MPRKGTGAYAIVAGGGKVGANVSRSLLDFGHEVTLIEQRRDRFQRLEEELGPVALLGDATEIHILERAGIARPPDLVLAVTGDDEDNLVIAQIAQEGYEVPKVIARVNDPRNQEHFDTLGIAQTVCATSGILGLVQHEVPEHGVVRLLELRREGLEVVELQLHADAPRGRQARRRPAAPRRLATRLGDAERRRRDRRRRDGAPARRPGDRHPQAGSRGSVQARARWLGGRRGWPG